MNQFRIFMFLATCLLSISASAATFTVTKTADTDDNVCDADCSLREAIFAATNGDTILFSALFNTTQTISLSGTELLIDKNLTIIGAGADKLTISAGSLSRVLHFSGADVLMSALKIADGNNVSNGGGIFIQGGSLNLDKVIISNNTVNGAPGSTTFGGGIDNQGTLTITNSEISGNIALERGNGGGIQNGRLFTPASLFLINTTISGNSALSIGGGISNQQIQDLTHCTISANDSPSQAGVNNGFVSNTMIGNTIIAGNIGPTEVFGNFSSQGFNLVGDGTGSTSLTHPTDQVGTNALPINALLGSLSNSSGTTKTHPLLTGSPAIDQGNNFGFAADQRGQNRTTDIGTIANAIGGDGTDIGAFEGLAPSAAEAVVSGKVVSEKWQTISRALVSLTDTHGNIRTAMTNNFGRFQFEGIAVGETYIVNAQAKGFNFSPRVLTIKDSIADYVLSPN